jgi:hypothetical protein
LFVDHSIIQSAIEQAKMKFFILGKDRVIKLCSEAKEKEDEKFSSESIYRSMNELKAITSSKDKIKSQDFVYDSVSRLLNSVVECKGSCGEVAGKIMVMQVERDC